MYHKFKAVIFDMDGILFDSEICIIDCWKEVAAKYDIQGVTEILPSCLGVNYEGTKQIFLNHYGQDFPYDEYKKECSKIYHGRYDGGKLPMKKGVTELLEYLQKEGYKIGLASSTREKTVLNQLRDAKIDSYFGDITCGDMLKRSKPEPDIYLMACEKTGVFPEEAIAIEDSYNGIRSAYRAGMFPIMVPDLVEPDDEMEKLSGVILESLIDVKEWLEKKGKRNGAN